MEAEGLYLSAVSVNYNDWGLGDEAAGREGLIQGHYVAEGTYDINEVIDEIEGATST